VARTSLSAKLAVQHVLADIIKIRTVNPVVNIVYEEDSKIRKVRKVVNFALTDGIKTRTSNPVARITVVLVPIYTQIVYHFGVRFGPSAKAAIHAPLESIKIRSGSPVV
jgi:hypothetical protein